MLQSNIEHQLPHPIQVVTNQSELNEVRELRALEYKTHYPSINVHNDIYDASAIIYYSRNQHGHVNSTARLVIDGASGLPEDKFFPPRVTEYRYQDKYLMELGRFIIRDSSPPLLKAYYKAFYDTALAHMVDVILMAMKPKDVSFHQRLIGAELLSSDINVTYGGAYSLTCVAWEISKTKPRFFDWIGGEK